MRALYPSSQPLSPALAELAPSPWPWPDEAGEALLASLDAAMTATLAHITFVREQCLQRVHLRSEIAHYNSKIQKLSASSKPKDMERVARNNVKLEETCATLEALNADLSVVLRTLDETVALLLETVFREVSGTCVRCLP